MARSRFTAGYSWGAAIEAARPRRASIGRRTFRAVDPDGAASVDDDTSGCEQENWRVERYVPLELQRSRHRNGGEVEYSVVRDIEADGLPSGDDKRTIRSATPAVQL
jgi:hypothetical protein